MTLCDWALADAGAIATLADIAAHKTVLTARLETRCRIRARMTGKACILDLHLSQFLGGKRDKSKAGTDTVNARLIHFRA
ncbi:hypothetical protein AEAC466_08365 [Asticcacaulis sp. AC466]|nr:hypothetical protein AEAC466_08365 [Asticcacaulis sp. AC466]